jgi:hypothetical protein
MRKYIFILKIIIIGLLIIPGVALSDSPEFLKVKQALSTDGSHGTGVAIDSTTQDIIVTGYFSGEAIFDNTKLSSLGQSDIYLTRYDSNGKLLWAKQTGGSNSDIANAVAIDTSGKIVIIGEFLGSATFGKGEQNETILNSTSNDMFVAMYESSGNLLWARNAGAVSGSYAYGYGVAFDGNGNVYVTGKFYGTIFSGANQITSASGNFWNVFIAKYNLLGNLQWTKKTSGSGESVIIGNGIATDGSGVLITGSFNGSAILGSTTLTGYGKDDIFIARYAADGTFDWAVQGGGSGDDIGNAVTTDTSGNVYITGSFSASATFETTNLQTSEASSTDIFIAGYNSSGELLFAKKAGGPGDDAGKGISMDDSGNIIVTGDFFGTATFETATTELIQIQSAGDTDAFVAKYSTAGDCLIAGNAGGGEADSGTGIASVDGNIMVTGSFQDIATFGDKSIATYAGSDMFLSIFGVSSFSQDFSGNGQLGLEDAIGILQIISKLRQ